MQKITLTYKGEGSLRLNVPGHESVDIAKGKSHVFNSALEYKPYSVVAINWRNAGVLDILVEDANAPKAKEVKSEAKPEVKSEVKQEAKPEVKDEVKPEVKDAKSKQK